MAFFVGLETDVEGRLDKKLHKDKHKDPGLCVRE